MENAILNDFETKDLTLRYLKKENIPEILSFQDENTTPDVFVKITEYEFLESVEKDFVVGAYSENILVGFCLMIKKSRDREKFSSRYK